MSYTHAVRSSLAIALRRYTAACAIVMTLGLTGCGFHMRGTEIAPLAMQYQHLQLDLPAEAASLQQPLSTYLKNLGATVDTTAPTVLKVQHYHLYRQPLNGKLTEVQLRLVVEFSLYRNGQPISATRTIVAQRSYQYDRASVNIDNQEESYLINVMRDDVAQQIVRLLHTNRLPQPDARTTDQAP